MAFQAPSQDLPVVIPLWPEGVPATRRPDSRAARGPLGPEVVNEEGGVSNVAEPVLTAYGLHAGKANRPAVIICPGGGYAGLSMLNEGVSYADWLCSLGFTSFVLKYRLQEFGHPAPLQDVLRAVRIVRARSAEFSVDARRIIVIGSSAGGHVAASAGTLFDHPDGRTGVALDAVNGRPDYLILVYPVITLHDPFAHAGSREALIGSSPPPELIGMLSLEQQVTAATPPTLLIHTQEDNVVPVENSLLFFQQLTRVKVRAEMHCFERGPHGLGLGRNLGAASDWPRRAEEWLRSAGLLESARGGIQP